MSCESSYSSRFFPDEVLKVIFNHILGSRSESDRTRDHQSLNLRYVCRRWAYLILSKYLRTIRINQPNQIEDLLINWNHIYPSTSDSSLTFSPVQRLDIRSIHHRNNLQSCRFLGIYSSKTTIFGDPSKPELHLGYLLRVLHKFKYRKPYYPSVCTVYGVIQLINLLGQNIKTLNLTFSDSLGFHQPLITAISDLSQLRSLSISHAQDPAFGGSEEGKCYEPGTLINLLKSLPKLESLELGCGKALPDFTDSNLSLPNLTQLKLVHQTNSSDLGILSFCKLIQNQIKLFDFTTLPFSSSSSSSSFPNYFVKMMEFFQDELQVLRIDSRNSIHDLNLLISNLEFPKLKFYDPTLPFTHSDWSNLDKFIQSMSIFLQSEIIQELDTLVIGPYSDFMIGTPDCFAHHLKVLFQSWGFIKKKSGRLSRDFTCGENGPCRIPRDLKTIIFHKENALGNSSIDSIIDGFREMGIRCVFLDRNGLQNLFPF